MHILPVVHWIQVHSILPLLAVFLLILVTTYWPGRRSRVERHGLIPLQDDR